MLFSRTSRGTNAEMLIEMDNHAQDADRTCRHLLPGQSSSFARCSFGAFLHFCHNESGYGTRARCVGLATTRSCAARPLNTRVTRNALPVDTRFARELSQPGARAAARCLEARATTAGAE